MNDPGNHQGKLVLIADDDDHTRTLLEDLCTSAGFKVAPAKDGQEALDFCHQLRPDLLLLDLMMPRKDGFSVLKALRETASFAELPVILLTAMGDLDGKIKGMELGADDYVTKPFKLVELQTRIGSALTVRDYRKRLLAAEEELAHLRVLDPVTGAGTFSQLKASLDGELARSRRYGRPASILFFQIDDYAQMRQELGVKLCDRFIGDLCGKLRETLRGADRLFKVEADEFVVLLPETDRPGARIVAERLLQIVGSTTVERSGKHHHAKLHIGVGCFPHEKVRTAEDLLREAGKSLKVLTHSATTKLLFDP